MCAKTKEKLGKIDKNDSRWETGEIINPLKGTSTKMIGCKWMNHPTHKSIQVHPDMIEDYLRLGYQLGRKRKESTNTMEQMKNSLENLFE